MTNLEASMLAGLEDLATRVDQLAAVLDPAPRRPVPAAGDLRGRLHGLDQAFDALAATLRSQSAALQQQQDALDGYRVQLRALQDEAWSPVLPRG